MAAPIDFNSLEWVQWYHRYRSASTSHERSQLITEAMTTFHCSKTTVYKRVEQIRAGHDIFSVAKGRIKRRKNDRAKRLEENANRICHMIAVYREATRVGRKGYAASTEAIVEVLLAEGKVQKWELPSASTLRRWLKARGLSGRDFCRRTTPARSLSAERRNEVWFVDATPLNRYHLHLDGSVESINLEISDKHREEHLKRKHLQKVITFYAVDLYSGAYFLKAYPVDGESSAVWRRFLLEAMLPKENYPFEGIPEVFYTDMGSGLTAHDTLSLFGRLQTKLITHEPGNPSAKGHVEGRISAFKRSRETILNLLGNRLNSMELLNSYLLESARRHNEKSGKFARYLAEQTPLRTITEQSVKDLLTITRTRVISSYGEVSVKWPGEESTAYYVENGPIGARVSVYRSVDGRVVAQMTQPPFTIYQCDPKGRHRVGNIGQENSFATLDGRSMIYDKEGNHRRKLVLAEAKRVPGTVSTSSIFPPESNVRHFRPQGTPITTHSIAAREQFDSADEAWAFIHLEAGYRSTDLPAELQKAIDDRLSSECTLKGTIPFTVVQDIINILREPSVQEEIAKQ